MNKLCGFLSFTALTSSVLIATVNPASACLFSQSQGDASPTDVSPTLTNQTSSPDLNTFGIIASGAAALLVLGKLARAGIAETKAEQASDQSAFTIAIPPEAMTTAKEAEEEQLTSVS